MSKKEKWIIESLIWEMQESGKFDKDFSKFLSTNKIKIEDIRKLFDKVTK